MKRKKKERTIKDFVVFLEETQIETWNVCGATRSGGRLFFAGGPV